MEENEEKPDVKAELTRIHGSILKALGTLSRRGRVNPQTVDMIKGIIDFTYNTVKDHDCPVGITVLGEVMKNSMHIASLLASFEDHVSDDHDENGDPKPDSSETKTTPESTDPVVERKDNVIHVDLSKGKGRLN